VTFFPEAILCGLVFAAGNLLMIPFAYFKSLFHKWVLYRRRKSIALLCEAFTYTFTGIPILLLNQIVDYCNFMTHIYSEDMKRIGSSDKQPKISLKAFNKFHQIVHTRKGDKCNAKELVLECRKEF
jgi:hypothetical protein